MLGAITPVASAATLSLTGSAPNQTLTYTAGTNKTNNVTVSFAAGTYTVTETGTTDNIMTSIPGCSGSGTSMVSCPSTNVSALNVDGGNQADTLTVSATTPATFESGAGPDVMHGGSGADTFLTGSSPDGADTITGGAGTDTVDYSTRAGAIQVDLSVAGDDDGQGNEDDNLSTSDIENVLGGSHSNGDELIGNGLSNALIGGPGPDILTGNGGDDSFPQGTAIDGGDTITGGAGTDTVDYSQRTVAVLVNLATSGANDGQASEADNIATGDVENVSGGTQGDTLTGNALNNVFIGGLGNDAMAGAEGNDIFSSVTTGADGADTMAGGAGTDLVQYLNRTAGVRVDLTVASGDGASCPGAGCENDGVGADIETVFGGSGADTMIGDGSDETFVGLGGNDTLEGRGGIDTLLDTLFIQGGGTNAFRGGDGNDLLTGGPNDDTLQGGAGVDSLDGSTGTNTADFTDLAGPITVDLAAGSGGPAGELDSLTNIQHVDTGSGDDSLIGDGGPNVLKGGAGDDTIEGRGGNDSLQGGAGDDDIDGGAGTDTIDYLDRVVVGQAVAPDVTVDLGAGTGGTSGESDTLSEIENATGGEGNDVISGTTGNNVLRGSGGSDTAGYVDRSTDFTVDIAAGTAQTGGETDSLITIESASTGSGADSLKGDGGPNVLKGGPGTDTLDGRAGDDTLQGGFGGDQIEGGTGSNMLDMSNHTVAMTIDLRLSSITVAGETDNYTNIQSAFGGSGNDRLLGTAGPNVLRGGPGDDDIDALGGNDTLQGDDGSDFLRAGSAPDGADRLIGGDGATPSVRDGIDTADYSQRGADLLIDMKSVDGDAPDGENCPGPSCEGDFVAPIDVENVWAGAGNDTVIGTPNGNVLRGNGGRDSLDGFDADDTLDGGGNDGISDELIGGLGTDRVDYSNRTGAVVVDLGSTGATSGLGGEGSENDTISEVEDVTGGAGDDRLTGNDETINVLRGGEGNDTLDGRGRGDLLFGQSGTHDAVDYSARTEPVTARADGIAISGQKGEADIIGIDVEDLIGGAGDDHLDGRGNDNWLRGNAGNDTLVGRDGNDQLFGGDGNDVLQGGLGADALSGEALNDVLQGGEGNDALDGGVGSDTADYSERTLSVIADLASTGGVGTEADAYAQVENLIGGSADDTLSGDGSDNAISGRDGNDQLAGGDGSDVLEGNAGDDSYRAGLEANGADVFSGGSGSDLADYSQRGASIAVALDDVADDGQAGEKDNVGSDVESVNGGAAADQLIGNGASNDLAGLGGNDALAGSTGDDNLNGDGGDDTLDGDQGDDTLTAESGNDTLRGGEGDDTARGGEGDDSFDGGAGADLMVGGNGSDFVDYSGRAANQFVSLDDAADDGLPGEQDNARSDIERLATGPGADSINVANGTPNTVDCGAGRDVVDARDSNDALAQSCEPTICLACQDLVISDKPISISRTGVASVEISCRAPRACNGTVSLTLANGVRVNQKVKGKKRKVRIQSIGRGSFNLVSGAKGTVKIKVPAATRRALLSLKSPKVKIGVGLKGVVGSASRSVALKVVGVKTDRKGKR